MGQCCLTQKEESFLSHDAYRKIKTEVEEKNPSPAPSDLTCLICRNVLHGSLNMIVCHHCTWPLGHQKCLFLYRLEHSVCPYCHLPIPQKLGEMDKK